MHQSAITNRRGAFGLCAIASLVTLTGQAQASNEHLNLRVDRIDTAVSSTSFSDAVRKDREHGMANCWRVIQLDGPMTPQRRERLNTAGVRIAQYLPPNAFLVQSMGADCKQLDELEFIRWTGVYDASWKIDQSLRDSALSPNPIGSDDEAAVLITLHQSESPDEVFTTFNSIEGAVAFDASDIGGNQTISAVVPRAALDGLAALGSVQFIEPNAESVHRNGTSEWISQTNTPNDYAIWDMGLTGAGQIVGVIDGKIDVDHCSFADTEPIGPTHRKILAFNSPMNPPDRHGTHVAGIVAGDNGGADGSNLKGNAYDAKIVFSVNPTLSEVVVHDLFQLHHDQGARIHTNSWGWDHLTTYSSATRAVDVFSYNNEDDLILFAISNGTTVRIPENAKNCLAVAATLDDGFQDFWCFGGAGPTSDGRRKPEILAPGCGILSAKWNTACSSSADSGTSMATPAVAGIATLTRQWFMEGYYPSGTPTMSDAMTPTGALLKAMLMNSALDISGEPGYPSVREGWGRVLADNAMYFAGDTLKTVVRDVRNTDPEALATGQMAEHQIEVTDSGMQLRVTMVFTDAPATIGAALAPVNDIDLEVISPTGTPYKGNVFSGGVSATGGAFDAINNTEQVHVDSPELGVWTVRVHAPAVNVGTQGYAITATGAIADADLVGCPADINGDGIVDTADLGLLISSFGSLGAHPADLNGDGVVDTADLGIFIPEFGSSCL